MGRALARAWPRSVVRPFRKHGLGLVWPSQEERALLQFTERDKSGRVVGRWHHGPQARSRAEATAERVSKLPEFAGVTIEIIPERR